MNGTRKIFIPLTRGGIPLRIFSTSLSPQQPVRTFLVSQNYPVQQLVFPGHGIHGEGGPKKPLFGGNNNGTGPGVGPGGAAVGNPHPERMTFGQIQQQHQKHQQQQQQNQGKGSEELSVTPEVKVLTDNQSTYKYKYQASVYIGQRGFSSNNIQVSVDEDSGMVTVKAKEFEKGGRPGGEKRICSEVIRRFELPENVDLHDIKSALSPDGILTVQVPLPQPPNTTSPIIWSRKHWT